MRTATAYAVGRLVQALENEHAYLWERGLHRVPSEVELDGLEAIAALLTTPRIPARRAGGCLDHAGDPYPAGCPDCLESSAAALSPSGPIGLLLPGHWSEEDVRAARRLMGLER